MGRPMLPRPMKAMVDMISRGSGPARPLAGAGSAGRTWTVYQCCGVSRIPYTLTPAVQKRAGMAADTNWDHLRSLLAVARSGTFTAAAKSLGLKHSTVSRHLLELERSLHAELLDRAHGGMKLTSAGQRLHD